MNREIEARLRISAVDRTGTAFRAVSGKMEHINRRTAAFNSRQAAFSRMMQANDARMAALNARQSALARSSALVGSEMGLLSARFLGPAALAAGLYKTGKAAASFEESLFGIQKKSGATADEMARMKEEIFSITRELPVSLDEVAAAYERGAAAGIPLDDLREFATLTNKVADAWDVTAEAVGNTFAGFNKGLGIPLGEMQAYASLINDLADSGISDEADIADFIDRAGASLKNFGMSPEEIAAYGAALLNLKMPSEVAARAMDTVTGKLLAPENLSPKARTALQTIVGDMKEFQKLTGNDRMLAFLSKLEGLSSQKKASLLGAMLGEGFDDEIMRLVGGVDELYRNLKMAREHNERPSDSIAGVSEKKLNLFNSQLQILQNNLKSMAVEMGDTVLPAGTSALQSLNENTARNKAVRGALRKRGMGFLEAEWYRFRNPDEETRLAYEGGHRSEAFMKDYWAERYASGDVKPSTGRHNRRVVLAEFPGGGTGEKPLVGSRPSSLEGLADQYRLYGMGRAAGERAIDPYAIGRAGGLTDDAFDNFHKRAGASGNAGGISMPTGEQWRAAQTIDAGITGLKRSGEEAGQSVADGGAKAKDAIGEGAALIKVAGVDVGAAISSAAQSLLQAAREISRAKGTALGAGNGGGKINADTGRTMPANIGVPANTGG